jgi:hypothetical protein
MNKKNNIRLGGCLLAVALLSGCLTRESTVTREVSESGRGWAQTKVVQEHKGPGRKMKDRQVIRERIQCISPKTGGIMPADTEEECLKKGGRVINEITTDEYETFRK